MRTTWAVALGLLLSASAQAKAPTASEMTAFAEPLLAEAYAADGPGAAVLVARGDQLLYRGARGMASLELDVPLRPDHVFRIGSVTKQFGGAAVLRLADEGKLSLDDPLSKFLPDYPNGDAISVRQLLNHSSGVKSYTDVEGVMDGPIRRDLDTAALVASFKDLPADFAPGTDWAYNNSGYVLVGAIIEAASGQAWHQYLQQTLLAPLALEQTHYGADNLLIRGMARGYVGADAKAVPAPFLSMTQPHVAGALVSTVDDLWRWSQALHSGKVLTPASYQAMITPEAAAVEAGYGYGLMAGTLRGRPQLSHGGGIFGFSTHLLYVPEQQLSVVVLQNSNGGADPAQIAVKLAAFALGDPYPAAKPIELAEGTLESYEGVYRIDPSSTRELRLVDGTLISQRSGGEPFKLMPIAADTLLFEDGGLTSIRIERTEAGAISGMRLLLNGEGEGQFAARTDEALSTPRQPVSLSREQLQRVLGTYVGAPGQLTITLEGQQLKAQLSGQPAFDLFAESAQRFFLTVVAADLEFAPADGAVTSVTLYQGGAEIPFQRQP
jgi:CubicO group peptidase (beta-lactamase class C family)